jgi:hypothetical protein
MIAEAAKIKDPRILHLLSDIRRLDASSFRRGTLALQSDAHSRWSAQYFESLLMGATRSMLKVVS